MLGQRFLWNEDVNCQSRYFISIGLSSVKRLQIDTDMLLIITSTGDTVYTDSLGGSANAVARPVSFA